MTPFSRRAFISGALAALGGSIARAQELGTGCASTFRSASSQFVRLEPATPLPELTLERLDGRAMRLGDFQGGLVLMSFWATWCPPCRRELPMPERLRQAGREIPLEVVAVSIDQGGRAAVAPFLRNLKISKLKPFVDPEGRLAQPVGASAEAPFVLSGLPISFVVDRSSTAVGYITGDVDWTSPEALAFLKSCADA